VFAVTSQTMILAPILPRVAEQLRVSEARLSVVATGYAVAVALVAVVAGLVSDRVGRRRIMLAGAGIGGEMAGGAYALSGYASNAALAAVTSIVIALLVWRMLPDTGPGSGDEKQVDAGRDA
jgi:MFS family permease